MKGEKLRNMREQRGFSQEALGKEARCSRQTISLIELDKVSPTLDTLYRIAAALDMPAAYFLD